MSFQKNKSRTWKLVKNLIFNDLRYTSKTLSIMDHKSLFREIRFIRLLQLFEKRSTNPLKRPIYRGFGAYI